MQTGHTCPFFDRTLGQFRQCGVKHLFAEQIPATELAFRSICAFMRALSAIWLAPYISSRKWALSLPTPCSADTAPPIADTSAAHRANSSVPRAYSSAERGKMFTWHVVASNVAPRGTLETAFGERATIHRDYIAQAIVRHRHVATEFRDGRVGATTLVDKHVHAFGNRMAEEALARALGFSRRDPRALGIAAARFQLLAQHHELGLGGFLIVAAQLDEHACSRIVGEFREFGECRIVRLLRTQNVERSAIEVLDGRRMFKRVAHGDREIDRLGLAGKKQLAPHTSTGTGKSASSSSQITPSVPHAPMNRSIASMSSHAK